MDSPCIKQTVCKALNKFQHGKYFVAYVLNVCLYLLCELHEPGRHFGITFWGLTSGQQYFRYVKVKFHGIELPV